MLFEIGKCYKHSAGNMMKILCKAESTVWGTTLVGEQAGTRNHSLVPVGWDSEDYTANWEEITHDEWMTNFS